MYAQNERFRPTEQEWKGQTNVIQTLKLWIYM